MNIPIKIEIRWQLGKCPFISFLFLLNGPGLYKKRLNLLVFNFDAYVEGDF